MTKIFFFSGSVRLSSKNMWKMRSADVKADRPIKQEVPLKLEMQYKNDMYFSFDFGWYSIHLDIVC